MEASPGKGEEKKVETSEFSTTVTSDPLTSIRRDHDSVDDFEHLEHDTSPTRDISHTAEDLLDKSPELRKEASADIESRNSADFSFLSETSKLDSPEEFAVTDSPKIEMHKVDEYDDKPLPNIPGNASVPPISVTAAFIEMERSGIKPETEECEFSDTSKVVIQDSLLESLRNETTHHEITDDVTPASKGEDHYFEDVSDEEFEFSTSSQPGKDDKPITSPPKFQSDVPQVPAKVEVDTKSALGQGDQVLSEIQHFPKHIVEEVVKTDKPQTATTELIDLSPPLTHETIAPENPKSDMKSKEELGSILQKSPQRLGAPILTLSSLNFKAWFNPDRLHPKVVELVYWRDPKKSGIVFGSIFGILLSLSYFSLISVVAYLSLAVLTATTSFRIYRNVLQAVQKTSDGHPFKDILELDLKLPQDKVREVTDIAVAHLNAGIAELRRLFLVEDLVDSIKFGVMLWCLTYVGAWFNGMTLIIIAFVALFSLPKVYENNKTQIDQNIDIVRSKIAEISSKIKATVKIGKKPEEKKE